MYRELTLTDALYIKQRVLLMLEKAFPSARICVDLTGSWEQFGYHLRVEMVEQYSERIVCAEHFNPEPYYDPEYSEEFLRNIARDIARRFCNYRMRDAWQN